MIINSTPSYMRDYYDYLVHQYRDEKIVFERKQDTVGLDDLTGGQLHALQEIEIPYLDRLFFCGKLYYHWDGHKRTFETRKREYCNPYPDLQIGWKCDTSTIEQSWMDKLRGRRYVHYSGEGVGGIPIVDELNRKYGPILYLGASDYRKGNYISINPMLKDYDFHLHPYTVIQELMMFLQSKTPHIPEMSDKIKLDAHGFDDASFRREKGGPTRKRK